MTAKKSGIPSHDMGHGVCGALCTKNKKTMTSNQGTASQLRRHTHHTQTPHNTHHPAPRLAYSAFFALGFSIRQIFFIMRQPQ